MPHTRHAYSRTPRSISCLRPLTVKNMCRQPYSCIFTLNTHSLTYSVSTLKVIVYECVSVRVCKGHFKRGRPLDCWIDIKNIWTCVQTTIISWRGARTGTKLNKQHKQALLPITSESHSSMLFRTSSRSFTQNPSRSILGQTQRRERAKSATWL